MKFKNVFTNEVMEINRTTKILTLLSVRSGDYFKGLSHDNFYFKDEDGVEWMYACPMSSDECRYNTKLGEELAFEEGKTFKISGYFIPSDINEIYRPRLIKN